MLHSRANRQDKVIENFKNMFNKNIPIYPHTVGFFCFAKNCGNYEIHRAYYTVTSNSVFSESFFLKTLKKKIHKKGVYFLISTRKYGLYIYHFIYSINTFLSLKLYVKTFN